MNYVRIHQHQLFLPENKRFIGAPLWPIQISNKIAKVFGASLYHLFLTPKLGRVSGNTENQKIFFKLGQILEYFMTVMTCTWHGYLKQERQYSICFSRINIPLPLPPTFLSCFVIFTHWKLANNQRAKKKKLLAL